MKEECTIFKKKNLIFTSHVFFTFLRRSPKASNIAKVTRDKIITNLGKKFKGYYCNQNYGYGTKQHLKAIRNLGITTHHRKTFSPINKIK